MEWLNTMNPPWVNRGSMENPFTNSASAHEFLPSLRSVAAREVPT